MVTDPLAGFKRAFVTGATGIVGVPLCRKLVDMGFEVSAYSRRTTNQVLPPSIDHVIGDISNLESLAAAAKDSDVVFHLAAAVHGSASTYGGFETVNVGGTENVVRVAAQSGAKLVHVSTANVDGYRRDTLRDSYAETKARAEEIVLREIDDGVLDAVIIRPATVFGSESGIAGLLVDRLLARKLKTLPAPSRQISPVWSEDLADALIQAAVSGVKREIYTVAGPTMSTGDFVAAVCESAGVRSPMVSIPLWAFVIPLQIAWWVKRFTRWVPPVSVESARSSSIYDGTRAATELGFSYTDISEIFATVST